MFFSLSFDIIFRFLIFISKPGQSILSFYLGRTSALTNLAKLPTFHNGNTIMTDYMDSIFTPIKYTHCKC